MTAFIILCTTAFSLLLCAVCVTDHVIGARERTRYGPQGNRKSDDFRNRHRVRLTHIYRHDVAGSAERSGTGG